MSTEKQDDKNNVHRIDSDASISIEDQKEVENNTDERDKIHIDTLVQKINRLPWRSYLRKQLRALFIGFLMLLFVLWIINLSREINPDQDAPNPNNVLLLDNNTAILLTTLSSFLFLVVLIAFTKVVFFDKKDDFIISSYKSPRAILFFLLTISFIAEVYILLDTALINVYLITGPVFTLQWIDKFIAVPYLLLGTDREAYANARALFFTALLVFNLLFPVFSFILIFTRYGRKTLKTTTQVDKQKKYSFKKFMLFLLAIPIMLLEFAGFSGLITSIPPLAIFLIILFIITFVWWIIQLAIILIKILRFTFILSYSNIAMILPIIFMFYLLPALVWGIWDMFLMITTNSYNETIYGFAFMKDIQVPYSGNLSGLNWFELLTVYISTVFYNTQSVIRIIQLDFIFIVGIASIVIGFAEGFTLFALIKSIRTGLSITKTGRIAKESAPRLIVLTKNVLIFITWLSLLWDKILHFWSYLIIQYDLNLPDMNLPFVFEPIYNFAINLSEISDIFIPLTILLIPFYFIIMSSFKFLSVSIAAERTGEDNQVFYLLISSAFILIITKIYSDIASLPEFLTIHHTYLPLKVVSNENILDFILKITELLETIGFFGGFFASLVVVSKKLLNKEDGK